MKVCSNCKTNLFDKFRMEFEGHCTNCDAYGVEVEE